MPILPKQLVVIGDSSVYGWGDTEGGGWCERLRKDWIKIPNAPIINPAIPQKIDKYKTAAIKEDKTTRNSAPEFAAIQ